MKTLRRYNSWCNSLSLYELIIFVMIGATLASVWFIYDITH